MLHPASAHFAIALPVVALVFGILYLIKPSEGMSKISTRVMVFSALFMVIAFFTGKEDGSEVYVFLTEQGQQLLVQHKNLGLYLAIAMGFSAVVKLFGCLKKLFKVEIFAILVLAIVTGGVMYQGKIGGDLTYQHGAHVKNHSDGLDCLADPREFLEE